MDRWIIDPENSRAEFDMRFLFFARMHGWFPRISGAAYLDPDDVPHSFVEAIIDATSATTGDKARDVQLHGPFFLDTPKYPLITFRSTAIELMGNNRARITGNLTIRDITNQARAIASKIGKNIL